MTIFETKRTDLPSDAEPSEIYQWFLYSDEKIQPLTFKSQNNLGGMQRRIFDRGVLCFDDETAVYRENDDRPYVMTVCDISDTKYVKILQYFF